MLKDSRVKVNEPNNARCTPLWRAASHGHFDVVKWWIASGREMDLGKPGDVEKTDAIGVAKKRCKRDVVALLERFKENPVETRDTVSVELGWYDEAASEMFALVVFLGWVAAGQRHHDFVACSQVLHYCRPATSGTPNAALLSTCGFLQGDYLWKGL